MRFNYKIIPLKAKHPAYPDEASVWMPVLPVSLSIGHGAKSPRIEALVDSGSSDTLFHADIAKHLKIDMTSGPMSTIGGIVSGPKINAYFHDVTLWVGASMIKIKAGFSAEMSAGAILGRHGFFEHFIVNFDPSNNPPGFELTPRRHLHE